MKDHFKHITLWGVLFFFGMIGLVWRMSHHDEQLINGANCTELYIIGSRTELKGVSLHTIAYKWQELHLTGIEPYLRKDYPVLLISRTARTPFVYCAAGKIGSTTWKTLIYRIQHGVYPDTNDIHRMGVRNFTWISQFSLQQAQEMLQDPSVVKFTFLRDPYLRFLSFYENKIKKLGGWLDMNATMSLEQVLNHIASHPAMMHKDVHLAPLSDLCGLFEIPYDFLGNMDRFEEDTRRVLQLLGIEDISDIPLLQRSGVSEAEKSKLRMLFSPGMILQIRRLYAADLAAMKMLGFSTLF